MGQTTRMLWLGFEERALARLTDVASGSYGLDFRTAALVELARWHATYGRVEESLATIDDVIASSGQAELNDDARALAIDLLTTAERVPEAAALLDAAPAHFRESSDGILRRANIVRRSGAVDVDAEVLRVVNEIYGRRGVAGIERIDTTRPLSLDNVRGAATTTAVEAAEKVSVVMPAYNAEYLIGYAIRGLLEQTWVNLEIIVVDDHSADGTADVVASFGDERIRLATNPGKGAYAARNHGLSLASGRFVTVHDADDWSHPEKLERQVQVLQRRHSVVGSHSACVRVSEAFDFVEPSLRPRRNKVITNTSSFLAHRRMFDVIGGWDEPSTSADNELIERCRQFYGPRSVVDVLDDVPLSLCLRAATSLTSSTAGTGILSLQHCMGARRVYRDAYTRWHRGTGFVRSLPLDTTQGAGQIVRPLLLEPHKPLAPVLDAIVLGDFTLAADATETTVDEVRALTAVGLRVGLVHVPIYESEFDRYREKDELPLGPLRSELVDLVDGDSVRFVTSGETVAATTLVIRPARVLGDHLVGLPDIDAESVAVVVDELDSVELVDGPTGGAAWAETLALMGFAHASWHPADPVARAAVSAAVASPVLAADDWCALSGRGMTLAHSLRGVAVSATEGSTC